MKFGTKIIHNKYSTDKYTGALSIPIYQASTYAQDIDERPEFDYSRSGNPTRQALEETVALLENGTKGYAFSSGMAATSSVLSIFKSGDHIIFSQDIYGGTFRAASTIFKRFGIEAEFVDTTNLEKIQNSIRPNTVGLFLETPSNPTFKITDLKACSKIGKENNLITIVDNTFMSPYLQRPLDLGIDIVIHSGTKFLGGHSDVLGGLVATKNKKLSEYIYSVQNGFGAVLGPQDSFLLLRGIKTLKVRLDYQQNTASQLAAWFNEHPKVKEVYYPELFSKEIRDIHFGQSDGPGAVFSVRFDTKEIAEYFLKNVKLGAVAVSLGGVETIISYPAKMSHASMPPDERNKRGITDELVRFSIGLEDFEDLKEDFDEVLISAIQRG